MIHHHTILLAILIAFTAFTSAHESALDKAAAMAEKRMLTEAVAKHHTLKANDMLEFYAQNAPDLLAEWKRRCKMQPEDAPAYLELLVNHFLYIDALKTSQPDEYKRLVEQQKTEHKIRDLSRKIQNLAQKPQPGKSSKTAEKARLDNLQQAKHELKTIMTNAFDEAQNRQQLEITRLENELRSLRQLADDRAANKQLILQQRFQLLTGQPWPEDTDNPK